MASKKIKAPIASIPVDEFRDHADSYDGICISCGEWTCGGCEPDARNYTCETCGNKQVYGAEEAMMMGWVEVSE